MSEMDGKPLSGEQEEASPSCPPAEDVQHQVERILASPELRRSCRLADFLAYIVEETLQGRQDRIKAYSIGIEVLGRDAAFDPQLDPVVRIEAGRLRRELEYYYLTTGRDDPVGIEIPKGAYVPHFFYRAHAAGPARPAGDGPTRSPPLPAMPPRGNGLWRRHWRWTLTGAVIASLFVLVGVSTWNERAETAMAGNIASQPTLLLLPFTDLGGGGNLGLRAAAIAEELKTRLVRFREIRVIAPDGAGAADREGWPAAQYLLDGSVRADEQRLRITGRLIDRASGTILWSDTYDISLAATDTIAVEQDIASRIADAVAQPYGVLFRAGVPAELGTASAGGADHYRCALDFYRYRSDLGAAMHAPVRACLLRSVADNPDNATAWAMLSYMYLDEDRFGFNRVASPPPAGRALAAARRAIQIDPTNVRGLQALMTALFFNRQPEEALRIGAQAYRLNPDDTELLGEYGSRLMQAGQHRRGMAMMEEAMARNPGATGLYAGLLALGAYLEGDDPRALTLIRRSDLQHFPIYHFVAALIFARNGLAAETAASREAFLRMRPGFFARFDAELDDRNFDAADRARLIEGAREAGFPVSPQAAEPAARIPAVRSY
ncbi:adenylate cyclase [Ancylobacter sp. TS-1]|uniref:adenylate cyclase n=1 Tax=Ancylobacter sp. TS-1 TaxID=1850374 RepID=UPI001265D314|nr:adenylate cyclase [Ancylobacter sp. TS-1]QFR34468.1 adenylate cyclase [Ancylobacter sp. TS-1]